MGGEGKTKWYPIDCTDDSKDGGDDSGCPACKEFPPPTVAVLTGCGHMFCLECIKTLAKQDGCKVKCPLCNYINVTTQIKCYTNTD